MLRLALVFLVIAMTGAVVGFGVFPTNVLLDLGKLTFTVCLTLAVIAFAVGTLRGSDDR